MIKYIIEGGQELHGGVTISGAKNAAVAILPATLLVEGKCHIENVPDISDVRLLLEILNDMGAQIRRLTPNALEIDCTRVRNTTAPIDLVRRIRASYYLLGAQLGRFGHARNAMPGGCNFGLRPIDQHIKGFEALGAVVEQSGGYVTCDAPEDGLKGGRVYLDIVSVGATMNILLAACLAEGTTTIENCAKEPHIVDLANFLNSMGARISGAGTDVIKVRGVKSLRGGSYSIIPDQIEAGTYMAAVSAAGGSVTIKNIIPKHLDCITAKLREMGMVIREDGDCLHMEKTRRLKRANVKTMPYPGFPTDMQPQIAVCMAMANGTSIVTEGIYDNRFRYTAELNRMGAHVQVEGKAAVIDGVRELHGCEVRACDLRAGAAMVIAALAAEGTTIIEDAHYIERGYEDIIGKLTALGANIKRIETFDPQPAVAGVG
ncbi:MAG: UDP-N-acetylglucosamine 1-carboxyvinyltransferase [Oscillospiraceae bacterium]|nr:UDP-N-acetylglucosamine 1-carboxyvinyltransferase [Oscillospiraceae bacterium]